MTKAGDLIWTSSVSSGVREQMLGAFRVYLLQILFKGQVDAASSIIPYL